MKIDKNRSMDILVVGRAGIDFNTEQLNCRFADIVSFTKSVGGSPANIAQGTAKLGLKTGFIGKVSGDGMGDYVVSRFKELGIDTTGVVTDRSGARNCLAITEIISPTESGSYFYRENTADLLLAPEEISENLIKNASAVLISGTALSRSPSREAVFSVIEYAKRHGTVVVFDIDYRPYGWYSGIETALYCMMAAEKCDVIIGNREEFNGIETLSMPSNRDNKRTARALIEKGVSLVIVKDGERGSCAFTSDGEVHGCGIIKTEIKKTFGSGDAFAAGLLYGFFRDMTITESLCYGSACASIVLQGVSCADAMPAPEAVQAYMKNHTFTEFSDRSGEKHENGQ